MEAGVGATERVETVPAGAGFPNVGGRAMGHTELTALGRMVGMVVHDLRNPMTTIKGMAGMLGEAGLLPEERILYAKMVVEEVDRLVEMTEDLLCLARGNGRSPRRSTFEVGAIVEEVASFFRQEFALKEIRFARDLRYRGPIEADRRGLTRLFRNVAANARDAMPEGGLFTVSTSEKGGRVTFRLSDTGTGVSHEVMASANLPALKCASPSLLKRSACVRLRRACSNSVVASSLPGAMSSAAEQALTDISLSLQRLCFALCSALSILARASSAESLSLLRC